VYGIACWHTLGREGVSMKWRVMVELGAADGTVQLHEVSSGECIDR
jgi:hypothetical protein